MSSTALALAEPSDAERFAAAFAAFVQAAPTSFHAAAAVSALLADRGFLRLDESQEWPTRPGRYLVVRDGSVIAWVQPESVGPLTPWRILGAHSDSPSLRVKATAGGFASEGWAQEFVEVYGGPILASWFDRDLEFAGRLVLRDGTSVLARTGAVARIPHLAPHLDRGINDGFAPERERQLQPLIGVVRGEDPGPSATELLARAAGLDPAAVLGADILMADTQPPARIGVGKELLASARMDNLVSVFAAVAALAQLPLTGTVISAAVAFDHEEIGSASRTGADGSLLDDVWTRVAEGLGASASQLLRARADSWFVSMDVGHLVHPNAATRHDPRLHPAPGAGPLLKVNANQRYTTDGRGEAFWASACAAAGVPFQLFVSNNDIPCGSTIGPLVSTRLGVRTVDVGAGVLSMHSVRELIHIDDLAALARAARAALAD